MFSNNGSVDQHLSMSTSLTPLILAKEMATCSFLCLPVLFIEHPMDLDTNILTGPRDTEEGHHEPTHPLHCEFGGDSRPQLERAKGWLWMWTQTWTRVLALCYCGPNTRQKQLKRKKDLFGPQLQRIQFKAHSSMTLCLS